MTEHIKKWIDIESDITDDLTNNNLLLGNGFSLEWDHTRFNQQDLKPQYLKEMQEENVEKCIEKLEQFNFDDDETCKKIVKKIINDKIHTDFMQGLFKKMPGKISNEKAKPFVDFLSLFSNYFTLNYDPLLYLIFNKFKKENMEKVNEVVVHKDLPQISNKEAEVSTRQNVEKILTPVIEKVLKASWAIEADGEKLLEEEITNQSHTFIKNKLVNILEKRSETAEAFKQITTQKGYIKKDYKIWFNNAIETALDIPVKNEQKILNFNDGFLKLKNNENFLIWNSANECNFFHLHGAFHLLNIGTNENEKNIKIRSTGKSSMMEEIRSYFETNKIPLSVLKSTQEEKMKSISKNSYLKNCYEHLKNIEGILLTFGVSFADNDQHIVNAIINNDKITKLYIGLYRNSENNYPDYNNISEKFSSIKDKIIYFETNTAIKKDKFVQEVENDQINE